MFKPPSPSPIGRLLTLLAVLALLAPLAGCEPPPKPRTWSGPALSAFTYTEVQFANPADSPPLPLAGLLFLPPDQAPEALVVVIHGSGTSRRDNPWYLSMVRHLLARGMAVLLPDKRGSESSGGDWRTAGFEELAQDTRAALRWARGQPALSALPQGLLGASQGGWVAALVAEAEPELAFAATVSSAAVPPEEQLLHEERNTIAAMTGSPLLGRLIAPVSAWVLRTWRQPEFWSHITGVDPVQHWRRSQMPLFAAFGEADEQNNVPVQESVRRLERLRAEGNRILDVQVYPGGAHAIEDPALGVVNPRFLEDMATFMLRAAAAR